MVFKSKRQNQITALLVMSALIVALVLPLASQPKPHFTDVPTTHWAYANIERAYSDGVMAGTGGNAAKYTGVFSPSGTLTEAQFVTILTRGFSLRSSKLQRSPLVLMPMVRSGGEGGRG